MPMIMQYAMCFHLYFVAITDGGRHAFSTNLDDHNRAVRQYLRNRRAQRQQ